eukprot:gene16114-21900_t
MWIYASSFHRFSGFVAKNTIFSTHRSSLTTRWIRSKSHFIQKLTNITGWKMDEIDPGNVSGTKLKILKYPHPKLRQENELIQNFSDEIKQIAKEMFLVMYAAQGIGLAAPQVGINKKLMVFNEAGDDKKPELEMILVNPMIINKSDEFFESEEGCLSFPQIEGRVMRHKWIEVEYQDLTGIKIQTIFKENPARIFQHEYDHLDK